MTRSLVTALFGMIVLLCLPGTGGARPEFAQKFRSKCKTCHIRNTNADLNQTGLDFKASLAREKVKEVRKDAPPKQEPPKVTTEPAGDGAGRAPLLPIIGKKEKEEKPPREEEPKREIYRWTGADGSETFTDNPDRHPPKPAAAVPQKSPKGSAARPAKPRRQEKPSPPAAQPETYARCMERLLIDAPFTPDSRAMMETLRAAEERCSRRTDTPQ